MRYYIAAAAVLMAGLSACSSQNSVMEAQELQQQKLTLQDVVPAMAPKTAEAKARQQKFLKNNTARFKSRKLASEYYVLQAQRNFNENELDSATILFNRAWLMDSTNNDVYWGYGLVYGREQQHDKALYILYKALEKDKENPRLLTDIATTHLARFYEHSNADDLLRSEKLLEQALALDPKHAADANYKLAVNNYYQRNYGKAWEYLHESIKQDKEKEDKRFISALMQKKHDPEGVYTQQQLQ